MLNVLLGQKGLICAEMFELAVCICVCLLCVVAPFVC